MSIDGITTSLDLGKVYESRLSAVQGHVKFLDGTEILSRVDGFPNGW